MRNNDRTQCHANNSMIHYPPKNSIYHNLNRYDSSKENPIKYQFDRNLSTVQVMSQPSRKTTMFKNLTLVLLAVIVIGSLFAADGPDAPASDSRIVPTHLSASTTATTKLSRTTGNDTTRTTSKPTQGKMHHEHEPSTIHQPSTEPIHANHSTL